VLGAVLTFAVALGAFMALASPSARPHVKVHVRKPAFGGMRVAGSPTEFASDGCTIVFTDSTHNHDWHTSANWAPARLPGPDDVACVPAGKKVVIKHDLKVKRFVNHGDMTLAGGNADFGSGVSGG
jgi:hypothetical protein